MFGGFNREFEEDPFFRYRHKCLVDRLLSQGYIASRLGKSFKTFYGRYQDPIEKYQREHHDIMRQHNDMMRNMMMPFGNPFGMMQPALTDGGQHRSYRHQMGGRHTDHDDFALAPRNMFDDMFMNMGRMMNPDFGSMNMANGNMHSYSSSTVMSYTNDGRGQPKVYQATTSTRQAPGGIKETRKAVRDSESGVHHMSVGHHLGDRSHVQERLRNSRTGEEEQRQEFMNMDETDAEAFNREWQERTRQSMQSIGYDGGHRNPRHRAIGHGGHYDERPRDRHSARAEVLDDDRDNRRGAAGRQPKKVRLNSRPTDRF